MILTLPDIRQRYQHDCGDAVSACVAQFHGLQPPPRASDSMSGTDPRTVAAVLRGLNLGVLSGTATLDDLRRWCSEKRPPIAVIHWPGSLWSHYVVIAGVQRNRIHIQCPTDGPGVYRVPEFLAAWKASDVPGFDPWLNWAIVGTPTPGV